MSHPLSEQIPNQDARESKAAIDVISKASKGLPHIKDFLEHLIRELGGPVDLAKGYAGILKSKDKRLTPYIKAKIYENVLKLIVMSESPDERQEELGLLSDTDIHNTLDGLLSVGRHTGRSATAEPNTTDGSPSKPAA